MASRMFYLRLLLSRSKKHYIFIGAGQCPVERAPVGMAGNSRGVR